VQMNVGVTNIEIPIRDEGVFGTESQRYLQWKGKAAALRQAEMRLPFARCGRYETGRFGPSSKHSSSRAGRPRLLR
jgi:hypothetical protein